MKLISLEQGSDQWLEWRKSKICATDVSILMRMNPFSSMTWYDLWVDKMGYSTPQKMTAAMQRGKDLEEPGRKHFISLIGIEVFPAVAESEEFPFVGASFDGLSADGKTLVEIKCPGPENYQRALQGEIPEMHIAQMQHQLLVSGLDYMYYFVFDGEHGIVRKVYRDDNFICRMIQVEEDFWYFVESLTAPSTEYIKG